MQHNAVYLLFCKFTLHVSGVNYTHHQDYTQLQLHGSLATLEGGGYTVPGAVVIVLCTPDDGCI